MSENEKGLYAKAAETQDKVLGDFERAVCKYIPDFILVENLFQNHAKLQSKDGIRLEFYLFGYYTWDDIVSIEDYERFLKYFAHYALMYIQENWQYYV